MISATQEVLDTFYWANGECCAGCDHWRFNNSVSGECRKAAPMSGEDRMELLGVSNSSLKIGVGHPLTRRDHKCGDFKDEFDWSTLPLGYLKRIGAKKGIKNGSD